MVSRKRNGGAPSGRRHVVKLLSAHKSLGPEGIGGLDVHHAVRLAPLFQGVEERARHAGTLDPLASGVLVVCLGTATKAIERIMGTEKEYIAEIDLSATSISDDLESPRQPVEVATPPTHAEVAAALAAHFVGTIRQTPPTFSAIQQGGTRAYHAARAGTPFEMQSREVTIHEARLESYAWPIARIWIRCGKGVYIRSIARDLGRALGVGGMLTALQRTRVGPFTIDRAIHAESLPARIEADLITPVEGIADAE